MSRTRGPATVRRPARTARSTGASRLSSRQARQPCSCRSRQMSDPRPRSGRAPPARSPGTGSGSAISQHGNERRPGRLGSASPAARPPRRGWRSASGGVAPAAAPPAPGPRPAAPARLRRSTPPANRLAPRPSARRLAAGHRTLPRHPARRVRSTASSWRDRCRWNIPAGFCVGP